MAVTWTRGWCSLQRVARLSSWPGQQHPQGAGDARPTPRTQLRAPQGIFTSASVPQSSRLWAFCSVLQCQNHPHYLQALPCGGCQCLPPPAARPLPRFSHPRPVASCPPHATTPWCHRLSPSPCLPCSAATPALLCWWPCPAPCQCPVASAASPAHGISKGPRGTGGVQGWQHRCPPPGCPPWPWAGTHASLLASDAAFCSLPNRGFNLPSRLAKSYPKQFPSRSSKSQ